MTDATNTTEATAAAVASDVRVFEGIVERYEVRPPSRFVFLVSASLCLLSVVFYTAATSERASSVIGFATKAPPPTARQKVQEALRRIDELRLQSRYDEAFALLHHYHELYPEEPNLNRELGWHHVEKGLFVFAAEYFELAAERTPANSKLNWRRGELHLRWGERIETEVARGDLDERERLRRLEDAANHFVRSRDFFTAANEGEYVYNRDGALERRARAIEGWHRCRLERASALYARAKGTFSTDARLAREALEELERLRQDDGLAERLRARTETLIRTIRREE